MLVSADIITTVATAEESKPGYLVQENLELNNSNFCYRDQHLVRASVEQDGRAWKRV